MGNLFLQGWTILLQLLLNNGADVNAPSSEYFGRTALHAAADGGDIDIVNLLTAARVVDAQPSKL
ncbi:ankyrin repeat-containing domain protein [Penicillium sp. CMV-2018d]|nr:ankyrin repeat-containing domain protein [Penicillium sp. CMV-2018d]